MPSQTCGPSGDASARRHAHIEPGIAPTKLAALRSCVIGVTRTLDEYAQARDRPDRCIVWGAARHPGLAKEVKGLSASRMQDAIAPTRGSVRPPRSSRDRDARAAKTASDAIRSPASLSARVHPGRAYGHDQAAKMHVAEFVLVHGSTQSPGGWDRLAGALGKHGHRITTIDLPVDQPEWTVADYAREAAVQAGEPADRRVVVGHTGAGVLLPAIAQAAGASVVAWLAA